MHCSQNTPQNTNDQNTKKQVNYWVYLTYRFLLCLMYCKTCCTSAIMVYIVALPEVFSWNYPPYIPALRIIVIRWQVRNKSTTCSALACFYSIIFWWVVLGGSHLHPLSCKDVILYKTTILDVAECNTPWLRSGTQHTSLETRWSWYSVNITLTSI